LEQRTRVSADNTDNFWLYPSTALPTRVTMKSLFQALANAADGAFVIDKDQRITYWNQAAQEIVGYTYHEVAGQPCYEILEGRDEQCRLICHDHCGVAVTTLAGGTVRNYDTCVHTKSGDVRWINMSTFTFPTNDDETSRVLIHLFRDATQKKQHEQFIYQVLESAKNLPNRDLPQASPSVSAEHPITELTNREREVLSLLAQGARTGDIAESLSISPATVRNHIRNILQKLQVHSRLEAVAYALKHGLLTNN
jgi:PAS domain S-box-containing protein